MGRRGRTQHRVRPGRRAIGLAGSSISWALVLTAVAAAVTAGPGSAAAVTGPLTDPLLAVSPAPDYPDICAPVGIDVTSPCLQVTLEAIDRARAAEGLGAMRLPADFPELPPPEQLFVVVDRERVDRGLAPVRRPDGHPGRRRRHGGGGRPTAPRPRGRLRQRRHRVPGRRDQRPRRRLRVDVRRRPGRRSGPLPAPGRLGVLGRPAPGAGPLRRRRSAGHGGGRRPDRGPLAR